MGQHNKSFARQGRGAGNGYNQNWHNSPLWDSIKKKNAKKSDDKVEEAQSEDVKNEDNSEQNSEQNSEESLKEKQRRMFAMIH